MIRSTSRIAILALASTALMTVPFAAKGSSNSDVPPVPGDGSTPPVVGEQPSVAAATAVVGAVSDIDTDVPMPVKVAGAGGGASPYPFEKLEVGQSFHIAGKKRSQINSTMHTANKRHRIPTLDANGQPVTQLKIGKNKAGEEIRKNIPVFTTAKEFEHFDVDATDPRGPGVRVYRTK